MLLFRPKECKSRVGSGLKTSIKNEKSKTSNDSDPQLGLGSISATHTYLQSREAVMCEREGWRPYQGPYVIRAGAVCGLTPPPPIHLIFLHRSSAWFPSFFTHTFIFYQHVGTGTPFIFYRTEQRGFYMYKPTQTNWCVLGWSLKKNPGAK